MMKVLRTASQGSNITGSFLKKECTTLRILQNTFQYFRRTHPVFLQKISK